MKPIRWLFLISPFLPLSLLADEAHSSALVDGEPISRNQSTFYCDSETATSASCSAALPAPYVAHGSAQAQISLAAGSIATSAAYTMGKSNSDGQAIAEGNLIYDFTVLNGPATGSLVISAVVSGGSLQVDPVCNFGYQIANTCGSEAIAYVELDPYISPKESYIGAPSALTSGIDQYVRSGTTLLQIAVPYGPNAAGAAGAAFYVSLESAASCSSYPGWQTPAGTCSATANNFNLQITGARVLDSTGAVVSGASVTGVSGFSPTGGPWIAPSGVVSLDSIVSTVQSGAWISIFGTNLAASTAVWKGDFPTSLGGASVTIDGRPAYLSYASPTQINLQVPDDPAIGPVPVVLTTAEGTFTSTVTLAQIAPSFFLLDSTHVSGIILRPDGSGTYGLGSSSYDILGPAGNSLGYVTAPAKAGDSVEVFGTGFGPTHPAVLAGQAFSGSAPAVNPVSLLINNTSATPGFAGLSGAGLDQINFTVPSGLGTGDVPLSAAAGGVVTPSGVVISLQ